MLGFYPLILVCYVVISTIIFVYFGEFISSKQLSSRTIFLAIVTSYIVGMGVGAGNFLSTKKISIKKVKNTMTICCSNNTYSNKCDFMEKFGCKSTYITLNSFNQIIFNSFIIYIIFFVFSICIPSVYVGFTRKMLEYEGKISEEILEKEKMMDIKYRISKRGLRSIRDELKKNPNSHESSFFSCRELSVYYRKLKFVSGILSVISILYIGWGICELVYINKIGFNLFSNDLYIIKLIFSMILLLYSVKFKTIFSKCQLNKVKGYEYFLYIIMMIIFLIGLYLSVNILSTNCISNYSKTYEKCCLNQISSNKCDFLKEDDCRSINSYIEVVPKITIIHIGNLINFYITFIYFIIQIIAIAIRYRTTEEEKEERREFENVLIKLGYQNLVNEYRLDENENEN